MKITKLVHACMVVEHDGKRILVDPGNYSWQSGTVTTDHMSAIDAVVTTHAHPDHIDESFVRAIKENSPDAAWYGPGQVVTQLSALGIEGTAASTDTDIAFLASEHADVSPWFSQQPEHTSYVLFGDVCVSGDCQTLTDIGGARILAAAVNGGPWGGVVGFTKMIESLPTKPSHVIPLHDWHWNDTARAGIYARLPEVMRQFGVEFIDIVNGEPIEV